MSVIVKSWYLHIFLPKFPFNVLNVQVINNLSTCWKNVEVTIYFSKTKSYRNWFLWHHNITASSVRKNRFLQKWCYNSTCLKNKSNFRLPVTTKNIFHGNLELIFSLQSLLLKLWSERNWTHSTTKLGMILRSTKRNW